MAKMIGARGREGHICRCCFKEPRDRGTIKAQEERQWVKEAKEQLAHGTYCGEYFCPECGGDPYDYDPYDNADLEDIRGVWCDVDWRKV